MKPSVSQSRVAKAFTLLELIIVVAIILILAAILFPVFGRSHSSPGRITCQSNLKQIALGFKQYIQDYDERYPVWQHGSDLTQGWSAAIQPYLKSTQIYQCPIETTPATNGPGSADYCDYFFNSNVGPQRGGREDAKVDNSASTIITGDAAPFSSGNSSNGGTISSWGAHPIDGTAIGLAIAQGQWDPAVAGTRHLDGANYGFADGHVKWLKPGKVTRNPTVKNDWTFRWSAKSHADSGS